MPCPYGVDWAINRNRVLLLKLADSCCLYLGSSVHDSSTGDEARKKSRADSTSRGFNVRSHSAVERGPYTSFECSPSVDEANAGADDEVIGAGLPLIQRLLLLNKRDNEMAKEEETKKLNETLSFDHPDPSPTGPMPFIQRLKLLKKKEEESMAKQSVVKTTSASLENKGSIDDGASSSEVVGGGLPLIQRLKLLKKKEEERQKEAIKSKSPVDDVPSAESQPEEPIGAGLPLVQRLMLLKKKEEDNTKPPETKKSEKCVEFSEKKLSKGLTPDISCSSLRRLSTLIELGMGQGSTMDDNSSETSVYNTKNNSANMICDMPSTKELENNEQSCDDSATIETICDKSNAITIESNAEQSDKEPVQSEDRASFEQPEPDLTAVQNLPQTRNEQSLELDIRVAQKRGILKSPSSTETSNNEELPGAEAKDTADDSYDGHAERRKRLQKSVAFCCDTPDTSPTDDHKPLKSQNDGLDSTIEILDREEQNQANAVLPVDDSTFVQDALSKTPFDSSGHHDDKMVQVISALHSLIKMQMVSSQIFFIDYVNTNYSDIADGYS